MSDLIDRQAAIKAVNTALFPKINTAKDAEKALRNLPSAQPERLTDDDFETIRIHLNAYKEKLCNQQRWEEADEYQRIIDRFMSFASAQPERTGRRIPCSERLPEEEERCYWVCTDTGYQCQCRWTDDVYGLGASNRWGWKIFDIPQYQKVTAWMPLPKPYREGEG